MRVQIVVGARPNFIKVTQFPRVLRERGIDYQIVHTGQHLQPDMSEVFFAQFGFQPDAFLATDSGSPATRLGSIMRRLEEAFIRYAPDWVLIPGDVDSTLAGALVANRLRIPLAHIESGLRSFDRSMPEENNRILTDAIADRCFVTEASGVENLLREGKSADNIHLVGNTMIDTLLAFDEQIRASDALHRFGLSAKQFALVTLHRPANVDTREGLLRIVQLVSNLGRQLPVLFPLHPRTRSRARDEDLLVALQDIEGVRVCSPVDYFAMQALIADAALVLTDSGGVQEETTYRGTPCLTLRASTERPVTVELGSNELLPFDSGSVLRRCREILDTGTQTRPPPPLWDGKATERIVDILQA